MSEHIFTTDPRVAPPIADPAIKERERRIVRLAERLGVGPEKNPRLCPVGLEAEGVIYGLDTLIHALLDRLSESEAGE